MSLTGLSEIELGICHSGIQSDGIFSVEIYS